ncbi:MAG: MBL fold metallo-hydrolase [Clostridia bacterium]|nr:MBL fold metallo-hydrolase [Clostridia bacterium]
MKLYLTGEPCSQQRHCYYVEGENVSFIVDCGYQRSYAGDELPHLTGEQIRKAQYLFLTHSHENQAGGLLHLMQSGFSGRVVLTTETARQLVVPLDEPILLEALCLPYAEAVLPGGLCVTWGRSGHCSGSVWLRMELGGRSILFSGDYLDSARVHTADPIQGLSADLAVLDCDYGTSAGGNSRRIQSGLLLDAIRDALADGRPVVLPVPLFGRGQGILSYIAEQLPDADVFGDDRFIEEFAHLDASAMWVQQGAMDRLADVFVRPIPEEFVALGVYFLSDPQLDRPSSRALVQQILLCGGRVIMTGTVEPRTHAAALMHAGRAQLIRYGVHCTQSDMLRIASQNAFRRVIAYRSDFEPTQAVYEV